MGIAFHALKPGVCGPSLEDAYEPFPRTHLRTGDMIYLLGRRDEKLLCTQCTHPHGVYFIQGAFDDPQTAEEAALDDSYFIGPLPLNMALPHDPIEWAGLYWPLQERKNVSGSLIAGSTDTPEQSSQP